MGLIDTNQRTKFIATKFEQIGLNLSSACDAGKIGAPTWDPSKNDMSKLFDAGKIKYELLDYIIRHSYWSGNEIVDDVGVASVLTLATAKPWTGTFCGDPTIPLGPFASFFDFLIESGALYLTSFGGPAGSVADMAKKGTFQEEITTLTDHQAVLTRIPIPIRKNTAEEPLARVLSKLDDAFAAFDKGEDQDATCGQKGTACAVDSHCCVGADLECSWLKCEPCTEKGGRCGIVSEGSDCCRNGNPDYKNTGRGLQCDLSLSFN